MSAVTIEYTDPEAVAGMKVTATPLSPSRTGYGPKIPSRYLLFYAGRWRRVYFAVYGNSGSAYVVYGGRDLYLDTDTEHRLGAL